MTALFSWFLIPLAALCMSGASDWFTTNYSVTASTAPGNLFLILWAFLTGSFFRFLIKRIIGQAAPVLSGKKELFLTDLAVSLLFTSVFLPYVPEKNRILSAFHVAFAFTATVLFYIVITFLDLKLYLRFPEHFTAFTWLLVFAAFMTTFLLSLSDFMISSALETFLTVFASFWMDMFYRKVAKLSASGLLDLK